MDRDELIRRSKRVLFWVLVLGGGLYFFVEFYLPQKMNQFGEVVERTRKESETEATVSETLIPGTPHYDTEVHRAYRKGEDYPRTYRLLKEKTSAGTAGVSDYRLMIHLLESEKDVGIASERRERELSEYRERLRDRDSR